MVGKLEFPEHGRFEMSHGSKLNRCGSVIRHDNRANRYLRFFRQRKLDQFSGTLTRKKATFEVVQSGCRNSVLDSISFSIPLVEIPLVD